MKKYILQHASVSQAEILDLVMPVNKKYAEATGFEYLTDSKVRCPDREYYWEKIAYLKEFLATAQDGDLVVWEDADSLNIGAESLEAALPANGVLGMTQNRGGLNNSRLLNWYNSGVIVLINSPSTRSFLDRAWGHGGRGDEDGLMAELKMTGWTIDGTKITALDPKWNCWRNNAHVCNNPVVKTFHGMKLDDKLSAIKSALETL